MEALGLDYPLEGVNPPSKETMDEIALRSANTNS